MLIIHIFTRNAQKQLRLCMRGIFWGVQQNALTATIFTAELYGGLTATKYTKEHHIYKAIFCAYSHSVLLDICSLHISKNRLIQRARPSVFEEGQAGRSIKFCRSRAILVQMAKKSSRSTRNCIPGSWCNHRSYYISGFSFKGKIPH